MECHNYGALNVKMLHLCIVSTSGKLPSQTNPLNVAAQGAVPKIPQSISARKRFEML